MCRFIRMTIGGIADMIGLTLITESSTAAANLYFCRPDLSNGHAPFGWYQPCVDSHFYKYDAQPCAMLTANARKHCLVCICNAYPSSELAVETAYHLGKVATVCVGLPCPHPPPAMMTGAYMRCRQPPTGGALTGPFLIHHHTLIVATRRILSLTVSLPVGLPRPQVNIVHVASVVNTLTSRCFTQPCDPAKLSRHNGLWAV